MKLCFENHLQFSFSDDENHFWQSGLRNGNNKEDGTEGVHYKAALCGSYLRGTASFLVPANPLTVGHVSQYGHTLNCR